MFYVVAFDPIKFLTSYTPQNDRLDQIFEKDIHAVCKKMTRNGPKMVIFEVWFNF